MNIEQVNQAVAELHEAFGHIQQPRSDFALEHFVVGQHDTEPMCYQQTVLEMHIKHQNIRRAIIQQKKLQIEIRNLRATRDELDELTAQEKEIDLEAVGYAMQGALREFSTLHTIFKSFPCQYTHDEIQGAQTEYWRARLTRQAEQEIAATGRIGVGNQDALRQIGVAVTPEVSELRRDINAPVAALSTGGD